MLYVRMQNCVPFRVFGYMQFDLFAEFGIFQAGLEPLHEASSPSRRHRQPELDFSVRYRVVRLWFDGLAGKTREPRWQSVAKGARHCVNESGVGARGTGNGHTRSTRQELPGFRGRRVAGVSVSTNLGNGSRAGFDENI